MINGLLAMATDKKTQDFVLDYLNNSGYDEMLGIDLNEDRYHFMYNIEGKYHHFQFYYTLSAAEMQP